MTFVTSKVVADALREVERIREGFVPGAAELADAPHLSHWTVEAQSAGLLYLIGEVSGHPLIDDGWCTTSAVLAADVNAGWVRTVSRYYRLGPRLGEMLQ